MLICGPWNDCANSWVASGGHLMIESPPLSSRASEQDEQFALVLDEVSRRLQAGEP